MKNFKKRLIALVALTCVALSAFAGCADKESSSKNESSEEPMNAVPFQWGGEDDDDITIDGVEINEDDPVKADHVDPSKSSDESSSDESSKSEEGTTGYTAGEPVTEIVPVTEANGEPVTQADGQPVTEVKTITNSTPQPDNSSNNNNNSNNNVSSNTDANYVSNTKGKYAMWIDISKDENFVFNDSFIRVTLKVKDDAPDGIYDISIDPDLSSIAGVSVIPDTIMNGSIKVGDVDADAVDTSKMNGFAIYGDKISVKQGDTIDFCINMKDNPGLAAFCVWYYYDSNAFEIIDCIPDGEFAEISKNSTQMG
ncbi:MAG: hypothetical protein K2O29_05290 [Ruminococcus sp.]|nr:hypothetical protein [Ruminococcus sp.]MDE6848030.1 hypothetical protein [Ruminococcus sp.]MDE7137856.1 hypothetical protein [Ruminococcus sp.]